MLNIYAGETALKTIKEKGFSADLFNSFLGASGGPKWFVLYGLDKYLFGDFFKGRSKPLNIVGSSAGAFRSACFAQQDPVAAIERFAKHYAETVYADDAKAAEITASAAQLLDALFGETGADEIIANPIFQAHFVVAKTNGLVSFENKILQGLGLVISLLANRLGRKNLAWQYQRYIFQNNSSDFSFTDLDNIPSKTVAFTVDNIKRALLASGAIPMVMQGIKDISGCPKGMYRDGGIIDYHFDLAIKNEGLTLYPHFSSSIKAGWFDKNTARTARKENYQKTVLICPSEKFIQALPYKKIPDRTDFIEMSVAQRQDYWQQVLTASETLAQAFDDFNKNQDIAKIKDINQLLS